MLNDDCLNVRLSDYFEARRREASGDAEGARGDAGALQEPDGSGGADGGTDSDGGE